MGQRSKFLLLLRPLPGQMAGKGKGVQRKLTHKPGTQQGPTTFCNKNQQAGPAKTPPENITAYGKHPNSNRNSNKGGDSPGAGILAWAIPPHLLAIPQHTSHNGSTATPRGSGTPNHQPTADKAVYAHQGRSSSGRLAFTG